MADKLIRVGKVSKIDYDKAMIAVTYPDLDDSVTVFLSTVSFNDEYKMPKIGDEVAVLHLPSGQARGLVLGHYWNKTNLPANHGNGLYRKEFGQEKGDAYAEYDDGEYTLSAPSIRFVTASNDTTVDDILARLTSLESRVSALEARVASLAARL